MTLYKALSPTLIGALLTTCLAAVPAFADEGDGTREPNGLIRSTLIVTSTNNATANSIVVFRLDTVGNPSLSYLTSLATGGAGGAGGNAGSVQFRNDLGAVVNYGSNSITQLIREGNFIYPVRKIDLAAGCTQPQSVAINHDHLYAVGANCVESHAWPSGRLDGSKVALTDASSAQIVAGQTWAAVTLKSGSVEQLPLTRQGALTGSGTTLALPADANDTPLGAAFWGDLLGVEPAHSKNSFALVDSHGTVHPILGPSPAFPGNAPCWLAKGPGNLWYAGNTPAKAISIFFSDGTGGSFYKSVPLPGGPTDITVSPDGKWLAVIYTADDGAHIGVFQIDAYGDLKAVGTTSAIGIASFNGVAFSQ